MSLYEGLATMLRCTIIRTSYSLRRLCVSVTCPTLHGNLMGTGSHRLPSHAELRNGNLPYYQKGTFLRSIFLLPFLCRFLKDTKGNEDGLDNDDSREHLSRQGIKS